jgi:hypothetical protein
MAVEPKLVVKADSAPVPEAAQACDVVGSVGDHPENFSTDLF